MDAHRFSSVQFSPMGFDAGGPKREPVSDTRWPVRDSASAAPGSIGNVNGADLIASVENRLDRRRFQDNH